MSGELLESLHEAVGIVAGTQEAARLHRAPAAVDVRAIRCKLGLSQPGFRQPFRLHARHRARLGAGAPPA
jgi:hypothetical protein